MIKSCTTQDDPTHFKSLFILFSFVLFINLFPVKVLHAAHIVELSIKGPVGPATTDYITRGINKGQKADLILIRIDTPGGLDASTRVIIQSFLSSNERIQLVIATLPPLVCVKNFNRTFIV